MGDLTRNFDSREFTCKCGCGFNRIAPELVEQIQLVRDFLWIIADKEIPVKITSGCRCPKHNKTIGGAPHSFHTQGLACDLVFEVIPVLHAGRIVYMADTLGVMNVGGIGVYPGRNFLHIDIRSHNNSGLSTVTWINENGFYCYGVNFKQPTDPCRSLGRCGVTINRT